MKTKHIDWITMWIEDKLSMIDTMHRNMQSDLNAGYSLTSNAILQQKENIENYEKNTFDQMDKILCSMTEQQGNKWCYYDMLRRGVISLI